ncbi:MAG: cytochrome-c peroxidase [Candidatus Sericytochromatia bacterium]
MPAALAFWRLVLLLGCVLLTACRAAAPLHSASPLVQNLRQNALIRQDAGAVSLGLRLFFEPKLSAGNRQSCASCHQPNRGFSNAEPNATGVTGQRGLRNVPTIYGMETYRSFFWDGRAASLEIQALGPITNPLEMNESLDRVVAKLEADTFYRTRFREVFQSPVTPQGIASALASFERALTLQASPYERYANGEIDSLDPEAMEGMGVFGRRAHCATCHKGVQFTDHQFHNIGVGFDRPNPDPGRQAVTGHPADHGAFRTPSLKQLHLTGPYMHDGSQRSLEEVVDYYDRGGHANPNLSNEMGPLDLSAQEKQQLLAFLRTLQSPGDNFDALTRLPGVTRPGEALPPSIAAHLRAPTRP